MYKQLPPLLPPNQAPAFRNVATVLLLEYPLLDGALHTGPVAPRHLQPNLTCCCILVGMGLVCPACDAE